jgi:hypothetical protein
MAEYEMNKNIEMVVTKKARFCRFADIRVIDIEKSMTNPKDGKYRYLSAKAL